jgi:hypothetical protein
VLGLDVPADLFAVFSDPQLTEAEQEFTRSFGELLRHLRLPVPREMASTGCGE